MALTLAETERLRAGTGHTVLLYLTDQCPVGCAHCSVDSRPDSPRISDWPLFQEMVAGIAALSRVGVVAISGGEPFVERRGLPMAVDAFHDAGQQVVLFTSGYWSGGTDRAPARWVTDVLAKTRTVFLSTDSFHQESVGRERFRTAASVIADAGCRLVVQVLDHGDDVAYARQSLAGAFGEQWSQRVDLKVITPLSRGRGRQVFALTKRFDAAALASCGLLGSPTIRYDGVVMPCCNESLITGEGPAELRRRVSTAAGVALALGDYSADPVLRILGGKGPGELVKLPGFTELAQDRYASVCDLCWRASALPARSAKAAVVVGALRELDTTSGGPR